MTDMKEREKSAIIQRPRLTMAADKSIYIFGRYFFFVW